MEATGKIGMGKVWPISKKKKKGGGGVDNLGVFYKIGGARNPLPAKTFWCVNSVLSNDTIKLLFMTIFVTDKVTAL